MANKYIQNRGYANVFTGRSAGEAAVNLTAKKVEDYERFIKEEEEALEQSQKKSSWGSVGGLALGLGAGLLTGGASIAVQAAAAGGATLLGRGAGSALAGKDKRLRQGSSSLFGKERYRKADRQIKDLRDERIQSTFSSALTAAATAGIFAKTQQGKGLLGGTKSGIETGTGLYTPSAQLGSGFGKSGGFGQLSRNILSATSASGFRPNLPQAAIPLNEMPVDILKILGYGQ